MKQLYMYDINLIFNFCCKNKCFKSPATLIWMLYVPESSVCKKELLSVSYTQGSHSIGKQKTGKMEKSNSKQGKHREFEIFWKNAGKTLGI